jgi:hypothetical protein
LGERESPMPMRRFAWGPACLQPRQTTALPGLQNPFCKTRPTAAAAARNKPATRPPAQKPPRPNTTTVTPPLPPPPPPPPPPQSRRPYHHHNHTPSPALPPSRKRLKNNRFPASPPHPIKAQEQPVRRHRGGPLLPFCCVPAAPLRRWGAAGRAGKASGWNGTPLVSRVVLGPTRIGLPQYQSVFGCQLKPKPNQTKPTQTQTQTQPTQTQPTLI